MGLWTQTGSAFSLAPDGVRTAVMSGTGLGQDHAPKLQLTDPENEVGVAIKASPDGRSCLQIDTVAATNKIQIRLVLFGQPGAMIVEETYANAGLTAGVPFTMQVRLIQGQLKVLINSVRVPALDLDTNYAQLAQFDYWGFVATSASGTLVLSAQVDTLVGVIAERADILAAWCNGEIWASDNPSAATPTISRRASNASSKTALVASCEFEQKALYVDGSTAGVFDVVSMTASLYGPTTGSLPGSGGAEGKTTATLIENHLGRIAFAGMRDDPQNIQFTPPNSYLDLSTGDGFNGTGYTLTAAKSARIGQPVKALLSCNGSVLAVGTQRGHWKIVGDPSLGSLDVSPLSTDTGVSGKDAMTLGARGQLVSHTQSGLATSTGDGLSYTSRRVLTELIQLTDALENYIAQTIRDPQRHGACIFLTARTSGNPSVHLWYDETIGNYRETGGGFFPETYPDRIGPTCSTWWNGDLILGGRTGYLYKFDDAASTDDGDEILSFAEFGLMVDPDIDKDCLLNNLSLVLSDDSQPVTVTVYGGATAEEAHNPDRRWVLYSRTVDTRTDGSGLARRNTSFGQHVRAPAMVVRIESTGRWCLEAMSAETTTGMLTTRNKRQTASTTTSTPGSSSSPELPPALSHADSGGTGRIGGEPPGTEPGGGGGPGGAGGPSAGGGSHSGDPQSPPPNAGGSGVAGTA